MSDEELIKRLVKSSELKCSQCLQFSECNSDDCEKVIAEKALDLINRQQAEIDDLKRDAVPKLQDSLNRANKYGRATDRENARLKAEIERYEKESNEQFDKIKLLDDRIKQRYAELFEEAKEFVRTEAIKECVDKYTEMLIDEYHLRTDLQIASIKRVAKKF